MNWLIFSQSINKKWNPEILSRIQEYLNLFVLEPIDINSKTYIQTDYPECNHNYYFLVKKEKAWCVKDWGKDDKNVDVIKEEPTQLENWKLYKISNLKRFDVNIESLTSTTTSLLHNIKIRLINGVRTQKGQQRYYDFLLPDINILHFDKKYKIFVNDIDTTNDIDIDNNADIIIPPFFYEKKCKDNEKYYKIEIKDDEKIITSKMISVGDKKEVSWAYASSPLLLKRNEYIYNSELDIEAEPLICGAILKDFTCPKEYEENFSTTREWINSLVSNRKLKQSRNLPININALRRSKNGI